MELQELRTEIDRIDDELVKLFARRMAVSQQIGDYKRENRLPVYVPSREREKLKDLREKSPEDLRSYTQLLYAHIFELSRSYQSQSDPAESRLFARICQAIDDTPPLFPQTPVVACQGVEGAYSQIACEKIFHSPDSL